MAVPPEAQDIAIPEALLKPGVAVTIFWPEMFIVAFIEPIATLIFKFPEESIEAMFPEISLRKTDPAAGILL